MPVTIGERKAVAGEVQRLRVLARNGRADAWMVAQEARTANAQETARVLTAMCIVVMELCDAIETLAGCGDD